MDVKPTPRPELEAELAAKVSPWPELVPEAASDPVVSPPVPSLAPSGPEAEQPRAATPIAAIQVILQQVKAPGNILSRAKEPL